MLDVTKIKFLKMHGLGNDFIIINKNDVVTTTNLIASMSHRQLGIGCDQFIIYEEQQNIVEMLVFNTDGSKASACGNASRCLALLLSKKYKHDTWQLLVSGRKLNCKVHQDNSVSVNMGEAQFDKQWMPRATSLWEIAERFKLNLREIICVDMGNPHLVIFSNNLTKVDQELLGEVLERHILFPDGININMANIIQPTVITLKVWERGTGGFTLACGSGACATYAAARKLGLIADDAQIQFEHGFLSMSVEQGIIMRGPATFVYEGEYYL